MKYAINILGKTKKQVTKINLSGKNLSEFPENLFEYTNLTKLILSNNNINAIPKDILRLKKLRVLDLANNNLSVLQAAVFQLPKLKTLNLYGNKLSSFPKQIINSKLQRLIVSKNPMNNDELEKLKGKFEIVSGENSIQKHEESNNGMKSESKETKQKILKMKKIHHIFISYSHEDNDWLNKVLKHLKPLKRYYDNIDTWSDKEIIASDIWKEKIDSALNKATIAILLVSTDFLASDFIVNDELQPLLEKAQKEGVKIMPLILRPCGFFEESGLSKYQALNDPKKPLSGMTDFDQENALVNMVNTIKTLLSENT